MVATFANDAASGAWTAIHLGQFLGMALLLAGLLVLFLALDVADGPPRLVGFFGAIGAVVTLALAAVLYGVDGVANKQAVDAWVSAPAAEKATRFANAETLRWLETGIASYQNFVLGVALVLFAIAIVWTARLPRPIGYLMGLSGLAWLALGWLVGSAGFTSARAVPGYVSFFAGLAWMVWLLIVACGTKESAEIEPDSRSPARRNDAGAAARSR